VGQAVDEDGVQAWVAGQDLEAAAGCRVSFQNAGDVFSELFEHG
jgi:hypothetical protein